MSHVYQPVMIRYLLANQGIVDDLSIAREISQQDPSQVDYYRDVTNKMVGRVLRNRSIIEKIGSQYLLKDFSALSEKDVEELIDICTARLEQYIIKIGSTIWAHRIRSRGSIPGSIKYRVLKRAHFRCDCVA